MQTRAVEDKVTFTERQRVTKAENKLLQVSEMIYTFILYK